jgi:hypothetical protein
MSMNICISDELIPFIALFVQVSMYMVVSTIELITTSFTEISAAYPYSFEEHRPCERERENKEKRFSDSE